MSLLKELKVLHESDDLSELPHDVMHELEQHIHKGAKDLDKKIVNALELVKEAYKVENVELPDPSMKTGWQQFSQLLEYATQKLMKFRGIDGDWRMSANSVTEGLKESYTTFKYLMKNGDEETTGTVDAYDVSEVVEYIKEAVADSETKTKIKRDGDRVEMDFYRMNVKQPISVKINY